MMVASNPSIIFRSNHGLAEVLVLIGCARQMIWRSCIGNLDGMALADLHMLCEVALGRNVVFWSQPVSEESIYHPPNWFVGLFATFRISAST